MVYGVRLLGVAVVAATMALTGAARAQQPQALAQPALVVGIVDIPFILQNAAASKAVRAQLDKDDASYKANFTKRENELRSAYQELQNQLSLLGPDAQRDRRVAFEQRAADFDREVDFRKKDMQNRLNNAMKKVQDALKSTLQEMVNERKINLLLYRDAAVHYAPEMDLTEEAMKRLNAKLPTVKVDPPSPLPKAPASKAPAQKTTKGK